MLTRAYRLTDRLGVALLKSSAELSGWLLHGGQSMVAGSGNLLRMLLVLGLALLAGIRWLIYRIYAGFRRLFRGVYAVLGWLFRRISWVIGGVLHIFGWIVLRTSRAGLHVGERTAQVAQSSTAGMVSKTMARRSARAEMETGLAEDPLRAQNRILSVMFVLILAVLVVIVLWATTDRPTGLLPPAAGISLNAGISSGTPQTLAASPPALNVITPVPTATFLPEVLQVGGSLAYVVRERGQTDIWAVEIGSGAPIRIVSSPEDDRDPAWSHNGLRLAYASRQEDDNWDLYVYDLNTGETRRLTYNLAFEGRPKWSPDDAYLIYESYQPTTHLDIFAMKSDGTEAPSRLGASSDAPDFSPEWSPDGRRIAFVSWRDGNQDIYIFSLDTQETYNLTQTPNRQEDYPAWSPDGRYIAFSAVENGMETIFVQEVGNSSAPAVAAWLGRTPAWSPPSGESNNLVFAIDTADSISTFITAAPYGGGGVIAEVIQVPKGATMPVWINAPLPATLVSAGGLPLAILEDLYIEQVDPTDSGDPPYQLGSLVNVTGVEPAYLSDRVNDSFNALRVRANTVIGSDFLGELSAALWNLDYRPQPGEPNRNWHRTGRAFAINRNLIAGFPAPIEVVREDVGLYTYWRIYVRVAEAAQSGQLGEPLRRMPWDFDRSDIEAYDQGGRLRVTIPEGYYVDLTQVAEDYGWGRLSAGADWRNNFNARNYWVFVKPDGLTWEEAMLEIYTESELGGWVSTPTPGG